MGGDVLPVLQQLVADGLLGIRGPGPELWYAVQDIVNEMEAVQIIQHRHVKGGGRGPFFLVAMHVQIS
jgi:hypothetical protein